MLGDLKTGLRPLSYWTKTVSGIFEDPQTKTKSLQTKHKSSLCQFQIHLALKDNF